MDENSQFIHADHFSETALKAALSGLGISQVQLLETCLHAFELLGRLSGSGLPFLFKGGTSLLLHTAILRRISTDIDIVTPVKGEELLQTLRELAVGEPFVLFNEQDRGLRGLPNRRHFRYYYRPVSEPTTSIPVLLDVVEDDFSSLQVEERVIAQPWFTPTRESKVTIQTAASLLGDKLAAFAPRTTGVPYVKPDGSGGDLLQIAKQFYDTAILFDLLEKPSDCLRAWREHVKRESAYRSREFAEAEVLRDTFQACLAITMVNFGRRIHADSTTIWRGIGSLVNHVAGGSLSHQQVFEMAGKVAFLAAVLGSVSPEAHSNPVPPGELSALKGLKIGGGLQFLNPVGGASPLGLFYWSEAAKLAPETWIKA